MAYSRIVKVGDGSTVQFTLDFTLGYLSQSDVTCRVGTEVDGLGQPVYRTITWITAGLVSISGAAPGNGVPVVFERTVSKSQPKHDFSDGAAMIAQNFDENQLQAMMLVHEVLDGRLGTLQGDLDLGGFRAINAADPVNPQDLATRAYVDQLAVLPAGNVPPPTLGNVGMFLKATATGVWSWASITISDVIGAVKASIAQTRAGTDDNSLVTPLKLASIWKRSATNVSANTTVAKPADADLGRVYNLINSITITELWSGVAGEVAVFQIVNGVVFTHNATKLKLKGAGANITTVAGDVIEFTCLGGINWEQTGGLKADGTSWVAPVINNATADRFEYLYMGSL